MEPKNTGSDLEKINKALDGPIEWAARDKIKDTEEELEKKILHVYQEAYDGMRVEWDAFMREQKKELDAMLQMINTAKASQGVPAEQIRDMEYEYQRKLQNATLRNQRYKEIESEIIAQMTHANETAVNLVNGKMGRVYTLAYNVCPEVINEAEIGGFSLSLANQRAIDSAIAGEGNLLPDPSKRTLAEILKKTLDTGKDATWNRRILRSQITQGIILGESIDKIADRLQNVTDMNRASAVRNARTMVTGAQNKGRFDSYEAAEEEGIELVKVWIATKDERTRTSHAELHLKEAKRDKPFDNGLMYPADRSGAPREVYNCRCSMKTKILGFRSLEEDAPLLIEEAPAQQEQPQEKAFTGFSDQTKDEIYKFTDGQYRNLTEYAQYIATDDGMISRYMTDRSSWESNMLPKITQPEIEATNELLDAIHVQPVSDAPLFRIETYDLNGSLKEGDELDIGLRSTSRKSSFIDDVLSGKETDLFDQSDIDEVKNVIKYVFETSKSIPIDEYSKYPDQAENLISGRYTVSKIEQEQEYRRGGSVDLTLSAEEWLKYKGFEYEPYTSKKGTEMFKYTENGVEQTIKTTATKYVSEFQQSQKGIKVVYLKYQEDLQRRD